MTIDYIHIYLLYALLSYLLDKLVIFVEIHSSLTIDIDCVLSLYINIYMCFSKETLELKEHWQRNEGVSFLLKIIAYILVEMK